MLEKIMAASPNRSPSPISSRINPISRTPESGNSIRKSLSGNLVSKPSIAAPRGFNPVTPANSPSDFPQRNLGFKEGIRVSFSEKENERDRSSTNSSKARSPVVSKGTKSFMAPTISATSKFTPSPRKKVLAERNDPVRTSLSSADGKSPLPSMSLARSSEIEENRLKSEVGLDSQVVSDAPKISHVSAKPRSLELGSSHSPDSASLEFSKTENIGSKPVMGLDSQAFLGTPKIQEFSPKPKATDLDSEVDLGSASLPILDSSDSSKTENTGSESAMGLDPQALSDTPKAPDIQNPSSSPELDPSLPPYDPKTNYLSPRPQFLRYKPNPRIEVYLNKENKNLEDSFTSESYSDSELTEETHSPDAEMESTAEIKAENVTEPCVLEPKSDTCNTHEENLEEEETAVSKEIPQKKSSCFFARPKFVSFLLLLAIACMSMPVTDSPIILSSSMIKDHPLAKTYVPKLRVLADQYLSYSYAEITEFTTVKLEWAANNLRLWSMNSLSYLARMISVPGEGQLVKFHYMNLTALDTDTSVNKLLDFNQVRETVENEEENRSQKLEEEPGHKESEIAEEEEQHYPESEILETIQDDVVIEEPREITQELEVERKKQTVVEEAQTLLESANVEEPHQSESSETHETVHEEPVLKEQQDHISHDPTTEGETVEAEKIEENGDFSSHAARSPDSDADHESHSGVESLDTPISTLADDYTMKTVLGTSSILLTLAAAAVAFLYLNRRRKGSVPEAEILIQPLSPKKKLPSHSASASSHSYSYRSSSHRNVPAEVEVDGESGPMEISCSLDDSLSTIQRGLDGVEIKSPSFEDSLSTSHRGSDRAEIKSHERKTRRNSMVSTSEFSAGSPSYGSFTSYEKLHKVTGDDDAITPVRRSSRLRKQITSP